MEMKRQIRSFASYSSIKFVRLFAFFDPQRRPPDQRKRARGYIMAIVGGGHVRTEDSLKTSQRPHDLR